MLYTHDLFHGAAVTAGFLEGNPFLFPIFRSASDQTQPNFLYLRGQATPPPQPHPCYNNYFLEAPINIVSKNFFKKMFLVKAHLF